MMTPEEVQGVRQEAREAEKRGLGGKSDRMREMVRYWKTHCPRMYRSLTTHGILWETALVQEARYLDTLAELSASPGYSRDAAQAEACDHLLMTPEENPDEGEETTI
ncbi:MAG: hypothetical protein U1E05_27850 [Patescibacteria group bacterium]|nr:hypothetical protein [Patescibacteria group bacterium]